jgi:hypothetical protein
VYAKVRRGGSWDSEKGRRRMGEDGAEVVVRHGDKGSQSRDASPQPNQLGSAT